MIVACPPLTIQDITELTLSSFGGRGRILARQQLRASRPGDTSNNIEHAIYAQTSPGAYAEQKNVVQDGYRYLVATSRVPHSEAHLTLPQRMLHCTIVFQKRIGLHQT